jgi:hypothetical protein
VEFPPQVWIEVLEKTSVEEKSSMVIVIQEHIREDQRTTIKQEKKTIRVTREVVGYCF